MKKTLVCILALVLALMMAVPAFAAEPIMDPKDARVGVILYPSSNTTIQVMIHGFMETAENLGMKTLYIGGDTSDSAAVEQMIDSAIAQYDDLTAVCLNISSETRWAMAKKFADAGIYVICCWSSLNEEDIKASGIDPKYILGYHATPAYDYGYEAGVHMGEAVGGKGTVAITQNQFMWNENEAARGFTEAIHEHYPEMKVLDPQLEGAEVTNGIAVITSIIQANFGELVGAFGLTGTSAQTWSTAAADLGWEGYVIGMDATSANLDILEEGGVGALVAQPMYGAYSDCAKHIYDFLSGVEVPFENWVECPTITAEQAPEYRDILNGVDVYESVFE